MALAVVGIGFVIGAAGAYWAYRPALLLGVALCLVGMVLGTVAGFL